MRSLHAQSRGFWFAYERTDNFPEAARRRCRHVFLAASWPDWKVSLVAAGHSGEMRPSPPTLRIVAKRRCWNIVWVRVLHTLAPHLHGFYAFTAGPGLGFRV
jgi:hypothetical protein